MIFFATCIKCFSGFSVGQQVKCKRVDSYVGQTKVSHILLNLDPANSVDIDTYSLYFELDNYTPISATYLRNSYIQNAIIN